MKCSTCGNEIEDDSRFCTSCGTPVSAEPQQAPAVAAATTSQPAQDARPPRNKLAIPLAIAAIVAVALVIVLVVMLVNKDDDAMPAAPTVASSSSSASSPAPTIETDLFRITLPADVASKITFTETNNTLHMTYTASDTYLAELFPKSDGSDYEIEYMYDMYSLGDVYNTGQDETAYLMLPLLSDDNALVHWSNKGHVELGITKLLGMTPEEFSACIELKTNSGFSPATPMLLSGRGAAESTSQNGNYSGTNPPAGAAPTQPFWGIWAQASKDKAEMESAAQRMRNDYGLNAFVVLTTDWSNLNSEPWYCVSLGSYPSQDAAYAALSHAQAAYADAYVKYSGNKK